MESKIITKFTIATEQGMAALLYLTQTIAREKFTSLLSKEQVENYLSANCSEKALIVEINSMSNQWLVVYADDQPAGYARITSKGEKPETITRRRTIRIADFGILKEAKDPAIIRSLFDKCLTICKSYEAVWINEYIQNPLIGFFESEGFAKQDGDFKMDELPLPSVCLIRAA